MLPLHLRELLLTFFVTIFAPTSFALADVQVGALKIGQPWSRATPNGAQVGAGYLTITNTGSQSDRLVGGSLVNGSRVEIHRTATEGGVMKMNPAQVAVSRSSRARPSRSSRAATTLCSWT